MDSKIIGYLCEINPQVLNEYKIKNRVTAFGLNVEDILDLASFQKEYKSISKFPSVKRDISMFVEKDTKYNEIVTKINEAGGKIDLGRRTF